MNNPITILITGAGGTAARNFVASLQDSIEPFRIIGTDTSKHRLQASNVDVWHLSPPNSSPDFVPFLNQISGQYGVDLLIPQPDSDVRVLAFADLNNRLKVATRLPSYDAISVGQDKLVTALTLLRKIPIAAFADLNRYDYDAAFNLVRQYGTADEDAPLWIRTTTGSGSKGALPVSTPDEARAWVSWWQNHRGVRPDQWMLCEYLPGKEYAHQSIWHNGELITSAARERVEHIFAKQMPSGQSSTPSFARIVRNEIVNDYAERAVRAIDPNPHGVYGVDLRCNTKGEPCVTEINAGRFFTTSLFWTRAGANMPLEHVRLALNHPTSDIPRRNACKPGATWTRGLDHEPVLRIA